MSQQLETYNRPQPLVLNQQFQTKLLEFNVALNTAPGPEEIKEHPYLTVSKTVDGQKVESKLQYLPIEFVEQKLNHYFHGLWQVTGFKYTVIVNEIVGDLELAVYHPEAGIWLRRAGAGAVVIQQRAEWELGENGQRKKKPQDLLDINRKIANTLVKDMGHLKSECIKNAAKSFGRTFGSDLSRDIENLGYADFMLTPEAVVEEIKDIESAAELKLYFDTLPIFARNDKRIRTLLKEKELELKSKSRQSNG